MDLGCGDGRHSDYFLSLGYQVVGVDFCKEAINICTSRFKGKNAQFHFLDLTQKKVLEKLGKFDIVIDWSILNHIRQEYLNSYLKNINSAIVEKGYLFVTAFDKSLPGIFKNKNYKVTRGHYSKAYSINGLIKLFSNLNLIDKKENILEDEINSYRFNTILMRK